MPAATSPQRLDGLWRHTCCEAFIRADGQPGYIELNLAPSSAWAIYGFEGYRQGMVPVPLPAPPLITTQKRGSELELLARIALDALGDGLAGADLRLGLSVVAEAADGPIGYWALRHPAGPPDFHHSEGFALSLPATADHPSWTGSSP